SVVGGDVSLLGIGQRRRGDAVVAAPVNRVDGPAIKASAAGHGDAPGVGGRVEAEAEGLREPAAVEQFGIDAALEEEIAPENRMIVVVAAENENGHGSQSVPRHRSSLG